MRHTDDVKHLEWSAASLEVATWFDAPGPWIVEGAAAVRALRKWLATNPFITPADAIYWMPAARGAPQPAGQAGHGQGLRQRSGRRSSPCSTRGASDRGRAPARGRALIPRWHRMATAVDDPLVQQAVQANLSPRYRQLDLLERYVDGTAIRGAPCPSSSDDHPLFDSNT